MASLRCIQLISLLAFVCLLNSAFSMPYVLDVEEGENENEMNAGKFEDYLEDIPDEEELLEAAGKDIEDPGEDDAETSFADARDEGIPKVDHDYGYKLDAEEDDEIIGKESIDDEEEKRDEDEEKRDEDEEKRDEDEEERDEDEEKRDEDEEKRVEDEDKIVEDEEKIVEDEDKRDEDEEKRDEDEEKRDEDNEEEDDDDDDEAGEHTEDGGYESPSYFKDMYEKAKQYIYGLGK